MRYKPVRALTLTMVLRYFFGLTPGVAMRYKPVRALTRASSKH